MNRGVYAGCMVSLVFGISAPPAALAWSSLTYQQALNLCANGYQQACAVAIQYEQNALQQIYSGGYGGYGGYGGSPADAWVSPQELQQGGMRGSRPGVFSTYDFVR